MNVNTVNTSRACSGFGSVKAVLLLSERVYSSSNCGIEINRDLNATRNILRLAPAMSLAEVSAGQFGNGVKEIDGAELWQGVVERTQNDTVAKRTIYWPFEQNSLTE